MNRMRASVSWLFAVCVILALSACSGGEEVAIAKPAPVHIEQGDECHVCGMVITNFPGPKAEAFKERDQAVRKFCSTREMFVWMLQPENRDRNHTLYVHDMAQTEWDSPDDTALIDAREAFYVVGSDKNGAMGPTLASFSAEADAHAFMSQHGGHVLRFDEVTLEDLNTGMSMDDMHNMHDDRNTHGMDHEMQHADDDMPHSMDH
ncbi:MAG TPA: nitrous oxide reductase accessory protein NosL [Marinobacter sp.]|nr:nitrous oxide reductase accessory protein NosL [Marinobacter sp.]